MVAIALYQPDIPQNVGAMMRLAACMGVPLHIIEPCGFPWDERKIRRSGMDYVDRAAIARHESWQKFMDEVQGKRIILSTTRSAESYCGFKFQKNDILLMGRESAGVPDDVHQAAHARITIPMAGASRSLNVVNAASMILGEMLRQVNQPR